MTRAFAITADAIATERARVNDDVHAINIANVISLDELTLPDVGPRDVKFRTLAVSAEHNLTHAATADTVNIADLRGGKIYPGNSAVGEVTEVGGEVTKFKVGDIVVTHCNGEPDEFGFRDRKHRDDLVHYQRLYPLMDHRHEFWIKDTFDQEAAAIRF